MKSLNFDKLSVGNKTEDVVKHIPSEAKGPGDTESNVGSGNEDVLEKMGEAELEKEIGTAIVKIRARDFKFSRKRQESFERLLALENKNKKYLALALFFLKMALDGAIGLGEKAQAATPANDKNMANLNWNVDGSDGHSGGDSGFSKTEGGGKGLHDPITFDISKYFKTGTFEYRNESDREAAITYLEYVIDGMDVINSDVSEVVIEGSASGGRSTGDSPIDNATLARGRAEEGKRVFIEALMRSDRYSEAEKRRIIASIKVVSMVKELTADEKARLTPLQKEEMYDKQQGATITIKAKLESTFEREDDFAGVSVVFGDASKSMTDDFGAVEAFVNNVNGIRPPEERINTIKIEGGDTEQHLQTIIHYLKSEEGKNTTGNMFMITDEGLNQPKGEKGPEYVKRYKAEIDEVLKLAGDRKIIVKFLNPKPRMPGEKNYKRYLIFNLQDKPLALQRTARPDDASSETALYAEERLNMDCFNKIERYKDQGDKKVEKEKVSGDRDFHGFKGN